MPTPQSETDELKALQQEVTELRAERKGRSSKAKTTADEEAQTPPAKKRSSRAASATAQTSQAREEESATEAPSQEAALEERAPEENQEPDLDKTLHDLVTHIDTIAKDLQEATKEHPSLGLMAAFTTGIVVGYLLTRRNV